MKRLSSLTDLLDLFSKYLMAFFTICALRGFEEETDAEDEPSAGADEVPVDGDDDAAAPSEVGAGGLSARKDIIDEWASLGVSIITVQTVYKITGYKKNLATR